MCRHLAYLGDPVSLRELVIEPPFGLYRQSWAPRHQKHGTVNVDGFGIGWYAEGDPVPARYRRTGPIWADPSLADLARVTRSTAVLAAVRDATEGTATGAEAAAPYGTGPWLFSHNGSIAGWPDSVADLAAARLTPTELLGLEARCDTALIWALTLRRLREGADPADALAAVVVDIAVHTSARLNLLLTDGAVIAATTWGDALGYRAGPGGVLVASEPPDDLPGWTDLPPRTLLRATRDGVDLRSLEEPPTAVTVASALVTPAAPFATYRSLTRETSVQCGPDVAPWKDEPAMSTRLPEGLTIDRHLPADFLASSLRADVLRGLSADPKWLPPKWFYDQRGSELFEEITLLPEYYPTRAEREILTARAGEIAAASGARTLLELGSGSATKTRLLLDALRDRGTLRRYVPVDVSESALVSSGVDLLERYPDLAVEAIVGDFEHGLPQLSEDAGPRLVVFLGGTIGNLPPGQRALFLSALRSGLTDQDALLLGADLVKDPATLVAAYDDAAGVTAEFNKNVLAVLNRELGADFDPDSFEHVAIWDPEAEWIEMRLRSIAAQTVKLPGVDLAVTFAEGEEMRTEISAKFRQNGLEAELAAAGFTMRKWWTDSAARFALTLSTPGL